MSARMRRRVPPPGIDTVTERRGAEVSVDIVADFYTRLLHDDETKDVVLDMLDGQLRAHSVVLCAGSEAIRGMLRNGVAAADGGTAPKRLSWQEHPVDVGRFFLRLLYTGTVDYDDWATTPIAPQAAAVAHTEEDGVEVTATFLARDGARPVDVKSEHETPTVDGAAHLAEELPTHVSHREAEERRHLARSDSTARRSGRADSARRVPHRTVGGEDDDEDYQHCVPVRLLLGALSIATLYMVRHLMPALTSALQHRITSSTFDSICAGAIQMDVTALRLQCLQFAQMDIHNFKIDEVREGMRVRAVRQITVQSACVPRGSLGTAVVQIETDDSDMTRPEVVIQWDCNFVNSVRRVLSSIEVVDHRHTVASVKQQYEAETLSPVVMSELAALWGTPRPHGKRRRQIRRVL
eukprot:TRINITY_DN898_c0_g1_i2.p1 TRINITY_DN898_c0_g1~~TRINITY_DN898_c0_g1_i2.p1  ORF type:complete len:409 (-),score=72.59 TRINITY_DN898_c0_g1_i2:207-1433(-)